MIGGTDMSSTEGKEQQLFCEWAKENETKIYSAGVQMIKVII